GGGGAAGAAGAGGGAGAAGGPWGAWARAGGPAPAGSVAIKGGGSTAAPRGGARGARPAFAEILAAGGYRRLWLSGLCLNTARWLDLVVLAWLALALTGSPFMVGLAAFARSAPMMALGPWSGALADRLHRGRVLLGTP